MYRSSEEQEHQAPGSGGQDGEVSHFEHCRRKEMRRDEKRDRGTETVGRASSEVGRCSTQVSTGPPDRLDIAKN